MKLGPIATLSLLLLAARAFAAPPAPPPDVAPPPAAHFPADQTDVVIPLQRVGDLLLTDAVKIDGHPAGWFILDTGSNHVTIDKTEAKILGLPEVRQLNGGRSIVATQLTAKAMGAGSFQIGGLRLEQHLIAEFDLSNLNALVGRRVCGLIGMDALRSVPWTLDYNHLTLTFHRPDHFTPPAGAESIAQPPNGDKLTFPVTVGGEKRVCQIDTGSEGFLDLVTPPSHVNTRDAINQPIHGMGGKTTGQLIPWTTVEILQHPICCPYLSINKNDPTHSDIVGTGLIQQFRLSVDPATHRLWAQWNPRPSIAQQLRDGLDLKSRDALGRTPLGLATWHDDVEAMRRLIAAGADVNTPDFVGDPPLAIACVRPGADAVRALLDAGADPNARIRKDGTPLAFAAVSGNVEAMELLLKRGADIHVEYTGHQDLLQIAVGQGHLAAVKFLLSRGLPVNGDPAGPPTLLLALTGHHNEVADLLIGAGVNIKAVDSFGESILDTAALAGRADLIRRGLAAGLNANGQSDKATPLMFAAQGGHIEAMQVLIDAGADVNRRGNGKVTALMLAASNDKPEAVKLLLAHHADPNAASPDRTTVLHAAANEDDAELCNLLLRAGAKVDAKNINGVTPLMVAATRGHAGTVRRLIAAGADVNAANTVGATPLMMAAESGTPETIKLLLKAGANVNAKTPDGSTAVLAAANRTGRDRYDVPAMTLLLEAGAKVDAADHDGRTPLIVACFSGRPEVVKLLLAHGADPNRVIALGMTPLISSLFGAPDRRVIEMLLKAGVDVNHRDAAGKTALYYARWRDDLEDAAILQAAGAR